MLWWELHVNRKELLKNWYAYLVIFIQCKINSRFKKLFKFGQIDQKDPQTAFHFGTQRTESFAFTHSFVFRNSWIEDRFSFPPNNHMNVSDSNGKNLNEKVDEELSWFFLTNPPHPLRFHFAEKLLIYLLHKLTQPLYSSYRNFVEYGFLRRHKNRLNRNFYVKLKFTERHKTPGITFKNMAFSKGNQLFAGDFRKFACSAYMIIG